MKKFLFMVVVLFAFAALAACAPAATPTAPPTPTPTVTVTPLSTSPMTFPAYMYVWQERGKDGMCTLHGRLYWRNLYDSPIIMTWVLVPPEPLGEDYNVEYYTYKKEFECVEDSYFSFELHY